MDAIVNGTVKEVVVFIKDTATTESYTYVHTLSLHDALPIFYHSLPAIQRLAPDVQERCLADPDADRILEAQTCQINPQMHIDRQVLETGDDPPDPLARAPRERSEEHTSELQSLMRISYAVFCLKKKKTNPRYKITSQ